MSLNDVIRQSFRLPLSQTHSVTVEIDGKEYEIVDLGNTGIGVKVPAQDTFKVGQDYSIKLAFNNEKFVITGTVMHISADADPSDELLCGIELKDEDSEEMAKYGEFFQHLRTKLFAKE